MAGAPALVLATLAAAAVLPISDAELREVTDVLGAQVAAVRHLPAPRAFERKLLTRSQAFAARSEAVAAAAGSPDAVARAELWGRMGLLPAGADYAQLVARSFGAPTASYDPASRRLTAPDWVPLVDQRTALAHELAHAIADQRFGLRQLLRLGLDGRHGLDSDSERARLALVEGDAALTALEASDPRGAFGTRPEIFALADRLRAGGPASTPSSTSSSTPSPTPPWIRANTAFAHADGLLFVARVRARAPWSAVDALWADPPASSEQVLHPAKYDTREAPVLVAFNQPRALGLGSLERSSDVLGELGVRAWLATAVAPAIAERAAAGWGGDRAVLYEPSGARESGAPFTQTVAWSTVWDDVTDAEDFARAAAVVLAALAGDPSAAAPEDPRRVVARGRRELFALAWSGQAVSLLFGVAEPELGALDELLVKPRNEGKPRKSPHRAPQGLPSPQPSPSGAGRGR